MPDASVADLRRLFQNDSVRTALLVDGPTFVGTVERDDVPPSAADEEPDSLGWWRAMDEGRDPTDAPDH